MKFSIYLNRRVFVMSYQEAFVISVPALCFQKFIVKLILKPEDGSDLFNFYSKLDFLIYFLNYLYFYLNY